MSLSTTPSGLPVAPLRNPMTVETVPVVSAFDIARTVFRCRWPIVLILITALVGAAAYLVSTTPTYKAESQVLVRVGREKLTPLTLGTQPFNNVVIGERVEDVNNEIQILRNPSLVVQVFPELKQHWEEILASIRPPPPPVTFLEWARYYARTAKDGLSEAWRWVSDTVHEPLYLLGISRRMTPDEMLFAAIQASIGVEFVKETNVINLSFSWSVPEFAAYALNTFVDAYRKEHVRIMGDVSGAADFYHAQLDRTTADLATIEQRIDAFLAESGMTDPAAEKQVVLNLVSALERQKAEAELAQQRTLSQLAAYQRQFDSGTEWLDTPAVPGVSLSSLTDIDARHSAMMVRRQTLLETRPPESQEVRDLDANNARLRALKLRSLQAYLNDRLAGERRELATVSERLATEQAHMQKLNIVSTRYIGMLDHRDQLLSQIKTYRQQIEQLGVTQALNQRGFASVTVLNQAVAPASPSAPKKGLILGLAAGFGAILAAAYVIVSKFFDRTFTTERDVARVLGLPVVATIPQLKRSRLVRRPI